MFLHALLQRLCGKFTATGYTGSSLRISSSHFINVLWQYWEIPALMGVFVCLCGWKWGVLRPSVSLGPGTAAVYAKAPFTSLSGPLPFKMQLISEYILDWYEVAIVCLISVFPTFFDIRMRKTQIHMECKLNYVNSSLIHFGNISTMTVNRGQGSVRTRVWMSQFNPSLVKAAEGMFQFVTLYTPPSLTTHSMFLGGTHGSTPWCHLQWGC